MLFSFILCALEINSNSKFKQPCGILLFDHWKKYISATTMFKATKLGKVMIYLEELLPIRLLHPLVMWSFKITWKTKTIIISITTMLMAPKLGRVITYLKGLQPIKSHGSLNKWSCEIFNQVILRDHLTS